MTSILLTGVGGQGTILMTKILSKALVELGYDVKMSEIHGMSQRGGTVNTQLRFGEKVYAPNISEGDADIIVAFEKVEALRARNIFVRYFPGPRTGDRLRISVGTDADMDQLLSALAELDVP